jgi:SAM-dependent methyltransferase
MSTMRLPYSTGFYERQQDGSLTSAQVVVPRLLELFSARSVVDVGCGVGTWLKAFADAGIEDYLGLDGAYVPHALLKIPSERFRATDIAQLTDVGRRFDLACSLEVAEHLPASSADSLVKALVAAAPVVLFSAAIPGQGGIDHVNEQWQSYWYERFKAHGYVAVDCIRPFVFNDARIEWWYRQNIVVYCEPSRVPEGWSPVSSAYALDRIDVAFLGEIPARCKPQSGREALRSIRESLGLIGRIMRERLVPARSAQRGELTQSAATA